MAKKKKDIENNTELVANCDHLEEVDANCDHLQFEVQNLHLKNADIESLIRMIRGQKVMVDFDLSILYGVKTKRLNEQVKRNIKRFPVAQYKIR